MKRITLGIAAHVDSGKTTLSEALLYLCGETRKIGRVDKGDSFLDINETERRRGITIFSKEALLHYDDTEIILLDTPGHTDFSAETERTFSVLDAAVLVISGTDGVQSHTETLRNMLESYDIPTFIFVNKTDITHRSKEELLQNIKEKLGKGCVSFENRDEDFLEEISLTDENIMNEYLENGSVSDDTIKRAVRMRKIFPVYFGSALKLTGIEPLLCGICKYSSEKKYGGDFGARVYKITEDGGKRLTHMKITGGKISVRDSVKYGESEEKINRIRIYNGARFSYVNEARAGQIIAVEGLTKTYAGEGLGVSRDFSGFLCEPVLSYSAEIIGNTDISTALSAFKKLEEEETELNVSFREASKEISVRIMGEIQLEILTEIMLERFGIHVRFTHGKVSYKETIKNTVEGMGHFEPLRHYAEVHLKLEPLPAGSGIIYDTDLSTDYLSANFQNLIISELKKKTHTGVLTGSPVTDIKVTLIGGKAHIKHTEGGDFRQAACRAFRQGLRSAETILLEPVYEFRLEVPTENAGRAMNDLQIMGADFSAPFSDGGYSVIEGDIPVSEAESYKKEIIAYTKGKGKIFCKFKGYFPCHNTDEIVKKIAYDCDSDTANPADSVFCSHGTGITVKWDEAPAKMHLGRCLCTKTDPFSDKTPEKPPGSFQARLYDDDELMKIFERTYGKINRDNKVKMRRDKKTEMNYKPSKEYRKSGREYLLVDGYNIIFSWEELKKIAEDNLDAARSALINRLCSYRGFTGCELILVFDAYRVKGDHREIEEIGGITVVYTKEAETADTFIEKTAHDLSAEHFVRVASSDGNEQVIILGNGALRTSAREFELEVISAEKMISDYLQLPQKRFTGLPTKNKE